MSILHRALSILLATMTIFSICFAEHRMHHSKHAAVFRHHVLSANNQALFAQQEKQAKKTILAAIKRNTMVSKHSDMWRFMLTQQSISQNGLGHDNTHRYLLNGLQLRYDLKEGWWRYEMGSTYSQHLNSSTYDAYQIEGQVLIKPIRKRWRYPIEPTLGIGYHYFNHSKSLVSGDYISFENANQWFFLPLGLKWPMLQKSIDVTLSWQSDILVASRWQNTLANQTVNLSDRARLRHRIAITIINQMRDGTRYVIEPFMTWRRINRTENKMIPDINGSWHIPSMRYRSFGLMVGTIGSL